eukprot:scaffold114177_cov42-Phaeocystis_antarctica.AAC.1
MSDIVSGARLPLPCVPPGSYAENGHTPPAACQGSGSGLRYGCRRGWGAPGAWHALFYPPPVSRHPPLRAAG